LPNLINFNFISSLILGKYFDWQVFWEPTGELKKKRGIYKFLSIIGVLKNIRYFDRRDDDLPNILLGFYWIFNYGSLVIWTFLEKLTPIFYIL